MDLEAPHTVDQLSDRIDAGWQARAEKQQALDTARQQLDEAIQELGAKVEERDERRAGRTKALVERVDETRD